MIPDTVGALLAFFGLIAPGLVFQLRRERHRPAETETAFREASRVALTSFGFTLAALLVLVWLAARWSALPDVGDWIDDSSQYWRDHPTEVARFLLLEVALACLLAVLVEWATRTDHGQISGVSVWYAVLRRDVPAEAARVWVWVTTDNGTQFKGALRAYTPGESADDFAIALGGEPLLRLAPPSTDGAEQTDWAHLDSFDAVIVPASDIRHLVVTYLDAAGGTLRAAQPQSWSQRLQARLRRP